MVTAFVYMFRAEESRKNLVDLYNNLPDGVIVLKPLDTGDVDGAQYDLLFCNQQTD